LLPISPWPLHAERAEKHSRQTWQYAYNGRQILAKIDTAKAYREGEPAYYGLPKKPPGRAIIVDGDRTINVALFSDGVYRDGRTIDNKGVEGGLDALDRQLEVEQLARPFQMKAAEGGAFVGDAANPEFFREIIHHAYDVIAAPAEQDKRSGW
jgi:hypothetical protein